MVAQASPAVGGIATFAETVVADPALNDRFELRLLNTTRRAVRRGGAFSPSNVTHAFVDAARVYRVARRCSVVHVQTALLPTLPLIRAVALCRSARLAGAVVLCHVHTGQANAGPNEAWAPSPLQRLLLGKLVRVGPILTVSEAGTAGLRPYLAGARIERVDNAVDPSSFELSSPGASPPTILFVGTLARRKGALDLVEALRRLADRGVREWRLEVVGSGSEAGRTEEAVVREAFRGAGLEASLLGPRSGDALRERLRGAQIYVLPSHTEGQPIGILEAMAAGLAVVATRVGAVPEMIRDGIDGLVVAPHDVEALAGALRLLLESPDLRTALGGSARTRVVERYGIDSLRRRLGALYGGAIAVAAGRPDPAQAQPRAHPEGHSRSPTGPGPAAC